MNNKNNKNNKGDITSGRIFLWAEAIVLVDVDPLWGIGNAQFSTYYYDRAEKNDYVDVLGVRSAAPGLSKNHIHVHKAFISYLTELGLIGFVLLMMMYYKVYRLIQNSGLSTGLKSSMRFSCLIMMLISCLSSSGSIFSVEFWIVLGVVESLSVRKRLKSRVVVCE